MKAFYIIFLFVFLTSCGANTATQVIKETTETPVANIEQDVPSEAQEVEETEPTPEPDAEPDAPAESYGWDNVDAPAESWGADAPAEDGDQDAPSEVSSEIDAELENMEKEESAPLQDTEPGVESEPVEEEAADEVSTESSLIELSTTYNNPKMEVVMNIALEVNDENIIESISVTSPNYRGMPEFNSGVQSVVWMSISEASEYYVSGSSLTTPAYQSALKKAL